MIRTVLTPRTTSELAEMLKCSSGPLLPTGTGTKLALSCASGVAGISMLQLQGILEYEPSEYTVTARAGTLLRDLGMALNEHGQYLPFDPMLCDSGATLGGTVSAAANGAGRIRFGGVRDFLVGIEYCNGHGALIRGGGKVVKNAAGFDLPKLFTGAMGRLGAITEVTFKVFPRPQGSLCAEIFFPNLQAAIEATAKAAGKNWEIEAMEIFPPNRVMLRLAGEASTLEQRMEGVMRTLGVAGRTLPTADADGLWTSLRELKDLPAADHLVKIPHTIHQVLPLHTALGEVPHHFSQAGNVAWVAWSGPLLPLHEMLLKQNLNGVVWRGEPALLGHNFAPSMERRVKLALDPMGRFPEFPHFISSPS